MTDAEKRKGVVVKLLGLTPMKAGTTDDLDAWVNATSTQLDEHAAMVSQVAAQLTLPQVDPATQSSFNTRPYEAQEGYAQANAKALLGARKVAPEVASGSPVTPEQLDPISKKKDALIRLRDGAAQVEQEADDAELLACLVQLGYCNLIGDAVAQMAAEGDRELKQIVLSQTASIRELEQEQKDKKDQQKSSRDKATGKLTDEVTLRQNQADALQAAQAVRRGEEADPEKVILAAHDLGTHVTPTHVMPTHDAAGRPIAPKAAGKAVSSQTTSPKGAVPSKSGDRRSKGRTRLH